MDGKTVYSGLNPLESGQSFEFNTGGSDITAIQLSQSPRIGAVIRIIDPLFDDGVRMSVSIPSNRGSHSNVFRHLFSLLYLVSLNPLESGQSFECQFAWCRFVWCRFVSIPSNRGSHSNLKEKFDQWMTALSLNPLESGQSFESTNPTEKPPGESRGSQSPRIGAVIRIFMYTPGPWERNGRSQSPRIGAVIRI